MLNNLKQHLLKEIAESISSKEKEVAESDDELEILNAKLKVENKILVMKDLKEILKDDFIYSVQALESILAMEQNRNFELKKDLEILKYREAVIESQFSDNELEPR